MKPQQYNPTEDPNASGVNLENPLAWVAGGISQIPSVTNLAEGVSGQLGTRKPPVVQVGDMARRGQEVVSSFRSMVGVNGYGPSDRAVQAIATAQNSVLFGFSKLLARLKA